MTQDAILEKVKRTCKAHEAKEVIFFGKRAQGKGDETSKFNIAISGADDFYELSEQINCIATLHSFSIVNLDTCNNIYFGNYTHKTGVKLI